MDLSNIITSKIYTIPTKGINHYVLDGITRMTGYEWKTYQLNESFSTLVLEKLFSIYTLWFGLLSLLSIIILGELIFLRTIKKEKMQYGESANRYIARNKFISYMCAAGLLFYVPILAYAFILVITSLVLNVPIIFVSGISIIIMSVLIILSGGIIFKCLIKINKRLFGNKIVTETKEEYDFRQDKYKFKDGSIVKFNPVILSSVSFNNSNVTSSMMRHCRNGEVYEVLNHAPNGRARLRMAKQENNTQPPRSEDNLVLASLDEVITFNKENEEYKNICIDKKLKEDKHFISRFINWVVN